MCHHDAHAPEQNICSEEIDEFALVSSLLEFYDSNYMYFMAAVVVALMHTTL